MVRKWAAGFCLRPRDVTVPALLHPTALHLSNGYNPTKVTNSHELELSAPQRQIASVLFTAVFHCPG